MKLNETWDLVEPLGPAPLNQMKRVSQNEVLITLKRRVRISNQSRPNNQYLRIIITNNKYSAVNTSISSKITRIQVTLYGRCTQLHMYIVGPRLLMSYKNMVINVIWEWGREGRVSPLKTIYILMTSRWFLGFFLFFKRFFSLVTFEEGMHIMISGSSYKLQVTSYKSQMKTTRNSNLKSA